jgi:F0F1-type ATP synthase assembly protein I
MSDKSHQQAVEQSAVRTTASEINIKTGADKILQTQAFLVIAVAIGFYVYGQQILVIPAALFGGGIAMLNVWFADRRLRKAASNIASGQEVSAFYIGAVQRFVSTLLLFILGMLFLKLMPLPLLVAFASAQAGYLFNNGQ